MKLFNNVVIIVLLLVPFLRPALYVIGDTFNSILNYYVMFEFVVLFIIYLKNNKISKLFILFFFLELIPLISTIVAGNYDYISSSIVNISSLLSLCMIYEMGFQVNKDRILDVSFLYFGFLLFINTITFFIYYPYGMDQGIYMDILGDKNFYFLGHDNGTIFYTIIVLFLSIYRSINKYGKISLLTKLYSIFIVLSYFYINSGNGKVVGLLILAYEFFYPFFEKQKWFNVRNLIVFYAAFYLLIVLFRTNLNVITIILDWLGKDYTFTGRTYIWDKAFHYIKLNPWIGYGYENSLFLIYKFGYAKLHNMVLQIAYNGGFIALSFLGLLYLLIFRSINGLKNLRYSKLELLFITVFLLATTFDYYSNRPITYLLFIMIFVGNNYIKGSDINEN